MTDPPPIKSTKTYIYILAVNFKLRQIKNVITTTCSCYQDIRRFGDSQGMQRMAQTNKQRES